MDPEVIPVLPAVTERDKSSVHLLAPRGSEDEVPGIETAESWDLRGLF